MASADEASVIEDEWCLQTKQGRVSQIGGRGFSVAIEEFSQRRYKELVKDSKASFPKRAVFVFKINEGNVFVHMLCRW